MNKKVKYGVCMGGVAMLYLGAVLIPGAQDALCAAANSLAEVCEVIKPEDMNMSVVPIDPTNELEIFPPTATPAVTVSPILE